jgi:hypothetical protein
MGQRRTDVFNVHIDGYDYDCLFAQLASLLGEAHLQCFLLETKVNLQSHN